MFYNTRLRKKNVVHTICHVDLLVIGLWFINTGQCALIQLYLKLPNLEKVIPLPQKCIFRYCIDVLPYVWGHAQDLYSEGIIL